MQRNAFSGSEFLLYDINNNPIALSKNCALKVNQKLSDITTKNSLGWTDLMPTIKDWSIEFEGLVSYGTGFTFSYFYQKYNDREPFFIRFGIIQDTFEHTFYGEVAIESIDQSASLDEIVSYSGSLKGIGNLSFTNLGTPEQNGYLKVESDPIFRGSPAFGITNELRNKWSESHDKTLTEIEFLTSGNTTTLKTHLRDGSIYSSSFINLGGSGGSINNLSFDSNNGLLSVGNLSTSLDGRYQLTGNYVGLNFLETNFYSKGQVDNTFYPSSNPFNFVTSDFTGFSLSGHTHHTLTGLTVSDYLVIPSTNSNINSSIFISDSFNSTGSTAPLISYLNDLQDVMIESAINGQALVYLNGNWINQNIVTDISSKANVDGSNINQSSFRSALGLGSFAYRNSLAYSELTGLPTLFDGNFHSLSNKPTIPTNNNQLTNGNEYITNSALTPYQLISGLGSFAFKSSLSYNELTGLPTSLSQFINDLGNYGNWITASALNPYQLSNGLGSFAFKNSLSFNELTGLPTSLGGYGIIDVYTKTQTDNRYVDLSSNQSISGVKTFTGSLIIPTNSIVNGSIFISDSFGSTGNTTPIFNGYLDDLQDVVLSSPASGQALLFNGSNWQNGSVVTDLSNYWNKSESDNRYYSVNNPSEYITSSALSPYQLISGLGSNAYTSTAYLPLSGGTLTGSLNLNGYSLHFDESGVRSWNISPYNGGLNFESGDGNGNFIFNGNSLGKSAYLTASTTPSANSVVQRDASAYINGSYINMTDGVVGSGVTGVIVKAGDNYYRTSDNGGIRTFLGLGASAYTAETLQSVTNRGQGTSNKIIVYKNSAVGDTYDTGLEIQGTYAGITFHYPGQYAAKLYIDGAGSLNWNGSGINANVFRGNLEGNATTTTQWGNRPANFDAVAPTNINFRPIGLDGADGIVKPLNQVPFQNWLGLGTAAYLTASNNSSTANTVVQRDSNGYTTQSYIKYEPEIDGSPLEQFAGFNSSYLRKYSTGDIKTALGLGTAAYQNNSKYYKYISNVSTGVNADNLAEFGTYLNTTGNGTGNSNFPNGYGFLVNDCNSGYGGFQISYNNDGVIKSRVRFPTTWTTWKTLQFREDLGTNAYNSIAYLPLTGGALTGALTGTSANFSNGLTVDNASGVNYIRNRGQTGTSYQQATLQLANTLAPRLGFHWEGVVASNITIESSGRIAIMNNPGTSYENFIANNITATGNIGALDIYNRSIISTGTISGSRGIFGYDSGVTGSVNASGWFRSGGQTGWINQDYGGGIYMADTSWIRIYGSKGLLLEGGIGVQSPRFMNTTEGFKSYNYRGLVGDYDQNGTTDKIIWTIGDNWNTLTTMYGIGYSYNNSFSANNHQIVFRSAGGITSSINLETGNAKFNGTVTSPRANHNIELIIPTIASTSNGAIWII